MPLSEPMNSPSTAPTAASVMPTLRAPRNEGNADQARKLKKVLAGPAPIEAASR